MGGYNIGKHKAHLGAVWKTQSAPGCGMAGAGVGEYRKNLGAVWRVR